MYEFLFLPSFNYNACILYLGLKITFVGEGKSHWSKRRGKTTVHYRGSEIYINAAMKLYEGGLFLSI